MSKVQCCNSKINITQFVICILITILFLLGVNYLYKRYTVLEGVDSDTSTNSIPQTATNVIPTTDATTASGASTGVISNLSLIHI